jgi:hypothetical protein
MNTGLFPPPRRRGLIVHGTILFVLIVIVVISFGILVRSQVGPVFLASLLTGLSAFLPIPFFGYRAYSLLRAKYELDRDSFSIQWGLRMEDIPLSDIEWMRPAEDLTNPLSLPAFRIPGSVLGLRRHQDLGVVEFLAAETKGLLLVATAKRVYAISPKNASGLMQTFARATELGSLTPVEGKSEYPTFVIAQAWQNPLTRFLWLTSLFINIGILIWAGLVIPNLTTISLGFDATGRPLAPVPGVQLILLPIMSVLLSTIGWSAGLYFFRWENERVLAHIVWITTTLTPFLFLVGVITATNV